MGKGLACKQSDRVTFEWARAACGPTQAQKASLAKKVSKAAAEQAAQSKNDSAGVRTQDLVRAHRM